MDTQHGHAMRPDAGIGLEAGAAPDPGGHALWHQSRAAWRFVLTRFVPLLTAANLVWKIFQLPFYTLWQEGTPRSRVFAILHCTAGDVMIGTAALLISVMFFGRRGWPRSRHGRVVGTATLIGVGYAVLSEWVNTEVTMGWAYAESMLRVPPLGTGVTPLLQWIIVPPLVYALAHALGRTRRTGSKS
ncbi:MAG: hypothetical protein HY322_03670 [Betaproteobacteria bacterium]|nr:hypothetical protein [Betaproteobacteria bacterium]